MISHFQPWNILKISLSNKSISNKGQLLIKLWVRWEPSGQGSLKIIGRDLAALFWLLDARPWSASWTAIQSWRSRSCPPFGNGRRILVRCRFGRMPLLPFCYLWILILWVGCWIGRRAGGILLRFVLRKRLATTSIAVGIFRSQVLTRHLERLGQLQDSSFLFHSSDPGSCLRLALHRPSCRRENIKSTDPN